MSEPPAGITVLPVAGPAEFSAGDDLAAAIASTAPWLADDDVVVVTSGVLSTVEDADASARALRARLGHLLGVDVAVVVSGTAGRTWREGLTDVAVGSAGIVALADHRGSPDVHDDRVENTWMAVVDELASAAGLVRSKGARVLVAVVRGLSVDRPTGTDEGTRPLVGSPADDFFPHGSRDLVGSRRPGAELVPRADEPAAVAEAFRVASAALPEFPVVLRYGGGDGVVDVHLGDVVSVTTALNLGALLGAVIVQLHAGGWTTRWEPVGTPGGSSLVGRLFLGTPPA